MRSGTGTGTGMGTALIVAVLVACGGPQGPRSGGDPNNAVVVVKANVKDAGLWVDGLFIGGLDTLRGGVAIDAGTHRFEVRHDDYFAYYEEVAVKSGERRNLEVQLAPVLP